MEDVAVRIRLPPPAATPALVAAAEKYAARCGFDQATAADFVEAIKAAVAAAVATNPAIVELTIVDNDDSIHATVRSESSSRKLARPDHRNLSANHGASVESSADSTSIGLVRSRL